MKQQAKDAFEHTIKEAGPEIKMERGELYVGNLCGLNMGEWLRTAKEEFAGMNAEIASLRTQVAQLNDNISTLNEDMSTLEHASQDYKRVRGRFISMFKRDKLEILTPWDKAIIIGSNVSVHDGDAPVDALLYAGVGARSDAFAFEELYGIHPYDVMKISM